MFIIIIFADEDLFKIQSRDPDIFEKIYKEYKTKIYNYLFIKANYNKVLADELFSDTFHSALLSAPKLKNTENVQSWLISIANRRFIDRLRSSYKNNYVINSHSMDNMEYSDTGNEIKNNDKVILTKLALNNIKGKYKEILTLKYIENRSQEEIAGMMNKSVPSVQSTLFRARESLKKELIKIAQG